MSQITEKEQDQKSLHIQKTLGEGFIRGKAGVMFNPSVKRKDPWGVFKEVNIQNEGQ